jgi:phosphoglycolate phosphatase-like HAD superfamily hydrolase
MSEDQSSFFFTIQNHLSNKWSGRLLALILRELGRQEPDSFSQIVRILLNSKRYLSGNRRRVIRDGRAQYEREWAFRGAQGRRYADLVVLNGGTPIIIFEIKEDDAQASRNSEQLDDYLDYIRKNYTSNNTPAFVHLSLYAPSKEAFDKLKRAQHDGFVAIDARYRLLHEALDSFDKPIARMLVEYLKEIGVTAYRVIDLDRDQNALTFYLVQMLGFRSRTGFGRLQSASAVVRIPKLLEILVGNLNFVGDWLQEANRDLIARRPIPRFRPEPHYNIKRLNATAAQIALSGKTVSALPGAEYIVDAGNVWHYTQARLNGGKNNDGPLGPGDWLYVEVGYCFSLQRGSKQGMAQPWIYSDIHWRGKADEDTYVVSKSLQIFPTEQEAVDLIRTCLKESLKAAKKSAVGSCLDALNAFRIP